MQPDADDEAILLLPDPPPTPAALLERHWAAISGAALAGALIGAIVGRALPSWYESTAKLVVIPVDDPTVVGGTNAVDGANATLPMLAAIMRSRTVADETVERLGLATVYRSTPDLARAELIGHLTVTTDRKANVVSVAAEDRSPERARDLAATVAELSSHRSVELWAARSHEHRLKLQAELAGVSTRLRTAEDALRTFREQNHVIDLPAQIKASVEVAAALEKQRIDKEVGLHFLRGFGGSSSVEVQRARRDREATARALEALVHGATAIGPLLPLDALPPLELEHTRLKRAIDVEAARYDVLSQKIGQLVAAEARPGGRPELVDEASLPRRRARPSRSLVCLQGAVAAALLMSLGLWLRARRRAGAA
jgi:uncharacterized protein involved in exopolysaccharide biosynthesis